MRVFKIESKLERQNVVGQKFQRAVIIFKLNIKQKMIISGLIIIFIIINYRRQFPEKSFVH